jgi:hypothetical protein
MSYKILIGKPEGKRQLGRSADGEDLKLNKM